jgi:hypothetical protein
MRSTCVWVILSLVMVASAAPAEAQLWKHFVPTARPAVNRRASDKLTQENGPWMILAATFTGDGAEDQAQDLVDEFRQRFRMTAYAHEMSFDYSEKKSPGRGVDEYGAPIRRRYQRGDRVREIAVLVGNYPSVDDPDAQEALEKIKTLQPNALRALDAEHTSQSMAQVREWQSQLLERLGKKRDRGPMSQAFLTRNPLLPREYFVPKGVDDFVAKMNRGVQHSLLECQGQYTVKVATFRGKSILQTSTTESDKAGSMWSWNKKERENPLVEAAENAHLLTEELRSHGWEAYEFHDRTESIVTIGAFADAGRTRDGQLAPTPEMQRIVETFSAAYDTPADPLSSIGNDTITQQRVHQKEQEFNMKLLGQQQNQIVPGLNPKHVKIFKSSGKKKTIERVIPLDVYPTAIEVPKRSVSSAYAG